MVCGKNITLQLLVPPSFCKRTFSFVFFLLLFCLHYEKAFGQIEFICPGGKDGLYAHPTQCDRYFECINKKVRRRLCADGLVFDPDRVKKSEHPCNQIHNTKDKCRGRPDLQRPTPGDANCPRQNGVYPSPDVTECDRFFSCLKGKSSSQQCADGLHFDPEIGTCVWARESSRKGKMFNNYCK